MKNIFKEDFLRDTSCVFTSKQIRFFSGSPDLTFLPVLRSYHLSLCNGPGFCFHPYSYALPLPAPSCLLIFWSLFLFKTEEPWLTPCAAYSSPLLSTWGGWSLCCSVLRQRSLSPANVRPLQSPSWSPSAR